jgi:outer membrane protein insertion porin family
MFIKILKINFAIIFLVSTCFATIVKDTNIIGNKRLSKESIILFGKVEIGKNYNSNDLNKILKRLYETNFFEKINLNLIDGVLNIDVIENPIIDSLTINGIKSSKLNEALIESLQLKSRKSYNKTIFLEDLNLLKNMIKSSGYYFADIQTSVIRNEKLNSIKLVYDVDLGDKAKINEIIFLGDKKIKDRKLKNVIVSEEQKFWKFISNKTFLEKKRIDLDTRLLTNYYKNKGYYNAKIENSFVEYKSNGSFKLIFNINSGNKFTFNNLNLVIPSDYDQKYFKDINKSLKKLNNKTYSLNKVNKLLKEVDKIALSKQYEFIDANLTEKIVGDNKLDFTITLKDTEKFYVETINILGNQYTLEEVIRNAFIVDEGDPYNEILFNKSINNLRGKNIFGFVKSNVKDGSRPNLKIIDIEVAEKPKGEISLCAGIGTS